MTSDEFVLRGREYLGRRVSRSDGGYQYWFDLEDFDLGLPSAEEPVLDVRTFGDFFESMPSDAAFGNALRRTGKLVHFDKTPNNLTDDCKDGFPQGGPGFALLYRFDISHAEGEEGEWVFWTRLFNPETASDHHGLDQDPNTAPSFDAMLTPDPVTGLYCRSWNLGTTTRIFESTAGPGYKWDNARGNEGHVMRLGDGVNRQLITHREGNTLRFLDVGMWTNDPNYVPTDA